MPTTVSLQRGSVTFTARADTTANITTLFTNSSSGIATRVIVNYLTVNNPFVSSSGTGMLSRNFNAGGYLGLVNGSAATMIGWMQGAVASPSTSSGVMTAAMPIADASAPVTNASLGSSFTGGSVDTNQVGFQNQQPSTISFSVGGSAQGYCPRTFWIGPSDSIRWWPRSSVWTQSSGKTGITNYVTQTLFYSFTLITES